jgi:acyl dehydratase
MSVKPGWRGRFFEDFEVGDVYGHPLGRTVTQTDTVMACRRGNGPSIPKAAS